MISDKHLKALLDDGSQSNWVPVIQARSFECLLSWHNGGCFETLGDNRQGKGEVRIVREDSS